MLSLNRGEQMAQVSVNKGSRVAWVILVGIWSSVLSVIMGALCCLTIVGIPCGLKYFKFLKIIFMPDGMTTAYRPTPKRRVLNIYWSVFGGYGMRFLYSVVAFVFRIFPPSRKIALRIDKMYAYLKTPFGAELIEYGKYTRQKNTMYDYTLLQRKICKNPMVPIFDDSKGRSVSVKKYLQKLGGAMSSIKRPSQIVIFLSLSVVIFGIASLSLSWIIGTVLIVFGLIVAIAMAEFRNYQYLRFYDQNMRPLFKLYGEDAEFEELPAGIKPSYVFEHLSNVHEENKRRSILAAAARQREKEKQDKK